MSSIQDFNQRTLQIILSPSKPASVLTLYVLIFSLNGTNTVNKLTSTRTRLTNHSLGETEEYILMFALLPIQLSHAKSYEIFEILDLHNFDRFSEVLSTDLEHDSGLQKSAGLANFIKVSTRHKARVSTDSTSM